MVGRLWVDVGQTTTEYALILALVSIVSIAVVGTVGYDLLDTFGELVEALGGDAGGHGNRGHHYGWGRGNGHGSP